MSRLILASASPRRKELLDLLGVEYRVEPSRYEEQMPERHPHPGVLAVHLAEAKAAETASRVEPGSVVVGADTLVALGDRLFGKPRDRADAVRMLTELSGRSHEVVTGVALLVGARRRLFWSRTEVVFHALTASEIEAYVDTGEPMDKAGAYAIQGFGAVLISEIRGDYATVVGFPIARVARALAAEGIGGRVVRD